jgi:hypothetical protein
MRGACERELCSACPTASERRRHRCGRDAAQAPVPRSYPSIVPIPRCYVFSWSTQKLCKYSSSTQKLRFLVGVPIYKTPNSLGNYSAIYSLLFASRTVDPENPSSFPRNCYTGRFLNKRKGLPTRPLSYLPQSTGRFFTTRGWSVTAQDQLVISK